MKILLAIVSCHNNAYYRACQRATWLPETEGKLDYRFFLGEGRSILRPPDEVFLNCPDDYLGLPVKVKAICQWAIENNYDYIFKCDDDTYVRPDRLMRCGFESYDYMGRLRPPSGHWSGHYAVGGPGYWLSSKALKIVSQADLTADMYEDRWVGNVLHNNGIECKHDERFLVSATGCDTTPRPANKVITACEMHGEKMWVAHRKWISGIPKDYVNDRMFGDVRRAKR